MLFKQTQKVHCIWDNLIFSWLKVFNPLKLLLPIDSLVNGIHVFLLKKPIYLAEPQFSEHYAGNYAEIFLIFFWTFIS